MLERARALVPQDLDRLVHGDVVRHANGDAYVVVRGSVPGGQRAIAIRTIEVSNLDEWRVLFLGAFHEGVSA